MPRSASLPFTLHRSQDVITGSAITTTKETVHGLLRLEPDRLTVQWRTSRQTDRVGWEIRTDREMGAVHTAAVPLRRIAGAHVRRRWWQWLTGPRFVLTAADLNAFEWIAGEEGLRVEHPAELVLRVRRSDALLAEEFAAELSLAVAELAIGSAAGPAAIQAPSTEKALDAGPTEPAGDVVPDSESEGPGPG